jgi:hypothetical protein
MFELSDDGILYPYGGKDVFEFYVDDESIEYWKNTDTSKAGMFATGRLMDEGWKMNY